MEGLVMKQSFWRNKSVVLTGHTGFKGGWLAHWLSVLGAKVHGFSLPPLNKPNFFSETRLQDIIETSTFGDIRNTDEMSDFLYQSQPEIIFHLAAQPLVLESYKEPVETFSSNVMGTINLFECARKTPSIRAIVNITSDKCYQNNEWVRPYTEDDKLGGKDPYSASKACVELVSEAYRRSYFNENNIQLATARAGNVIGGGDWSKNRLIPDALRAIDKNEPLIIRHPKAIRPWQHVLSPLEGYLLLAEKLYMNKDKFSEAWNFGPDNADSKSVRWIADYLKSERPNLNFIFKNEKNICEALTLKLDSSKAANRLKWSNRWDIKASIQMTLEWHSEWLKQKDMREVTRRQIESYMCT